MPPAASWLRRVREALPEAAVVRVDKHLLPGFRVLHHQQPEIGQRHLQRIEEPHRNDLVSLREVRERLSPAWRADEVRDNEHERAPGDHLRRGCEQISELRGSRLDALRAREDGLQDVQDVTASAARGNDVAQVGRAGRRLGGPRGHALQQLEDVDAAGARRQHGVDAVAVEQRADAVAAASEKPREQRHELRRDVALLDVARTEIDRRTQVEQQPGGDFALLVVLANIGNLEASRDVPVDVADVVVVLILAQIGEIEPVASEQRAVVAVQQSVEAANDRPLEPPEDVLRRPLRLGHAFRAVFPERARAS